MLVQHLNSKVKYNDDQTVTLPKDLFLHLLRSAIKAKGEFDESFYIMRYPDIQVAITKNLISSAIDHYLQTGYFEGRKPKHFVVDEEYYLTENKDVAAGLKKRAVFSAQQHFDDVGFEEGRIPFFGFSLF